MAAVGALIAAFVARALTGGDVHRALPVDVAALVLAALLVLSALWRGASFSPRRRRWHVVLALTFALGALRAALWWAGLPIQIANAIALALAGVALLGWLVRRLTKRGASTKTPRPGEPN